MYPELSGKVAVISGAGGNLGMAVARRLYQEKVQLVLIDRNEDRLRQSLREQGIDDPAIAVYPVDLMKKAEVDQFVDKAFASLGQIDILVNTAGGWKPGSPVHEMDEAQWNFMLDLNAKTTFLLSSAVARCMVAKGNSGRIVNVSGRAGLKGDANSAAYSAAKAATIRLTESMAAELLDRGITVNVILPSTIDTPQNRQGGGDFSKWVAPESIADVIAFLTSDSARDISGASIPVYGKS
jgi:NAD(P)-dependent dehydrogenase (short-subunit alcohol dehydrogenase family)